MTPTYHYAIQSGQITLLIPVPTQYQHESAQVEVISGLSALYPLIEQRRETLPRDLNDELESDSDESIIGVHEPAHAYEASLCSA